VGKWHLHTPDEAYDYVLAQGAIRDCGFDYAEAIYPENMGSPWSDPENNDGRNITHNMEHIVARAVEFMEESLDQAKKPFFLWVLLRGNLPASCSAGRSCYCRILVSSSF
jgi:hypothetical protein